MLNSMIRPLLGYGVKYVSDLDASKMFLDKQIQNKPGNRNKTVFVSAAKQHARHEAKKAKRGRSTYLFYIIMV